MNNPLSPVEVLDQTIEQLKEHIKRVNKLSCDDVMAIQFLAALELAKAHRELRALLDGKPASGPNGSVKDWHREHKRLQNQLRAADEKLTEALQS